MDKSEYEALQTLILNKEEKEKVRLKVTKMVKMLHEKGFVHGDIRDTNLLVNRNSLLSDEDAEAEVYFIDFDWGGRIGEAKYPTGINCKDVRRPGRVKGGGLITKEDDEEMVSYLF